MNPKIAIIGAGNIGSELYKRISQTAWEIVFIVKQDGIYKNISEKIDEVNNIKKYIKNIDLVFLAIPTIDNGLVAFEYMKMFLEKEIPVITCEKGALGNYFPELEKYLPLIGCSASVGGGTRILRYVQERVTKKTTKINAVLNGTLNYIFYQLSLDKKLEEAVLCAQKLGYAEPGTKNVLDVINKEALGDVPLKVSILFNTARLSSGFIRAKDLSVKNISQEELNILSANAKNFRYFVSINKGKPILEDCIGGFSLNSEDWYCLAGFRKVNSEFIANLKDTTNGIEIVEDGLDGVYCLSGPGAGAGPTVSSMIKDAEILWNTRRL